MVIVLMSPNKIILEWTLKIKFDEVKYKSFIMEWQMTLKLQVKNIKV